MLLALIEYKIINVIKLTLHSTTKHNKTKQKEAYDKRTHVTRTSLSSLGLTPDSFDSRWILWTLDCG